MDPHANAEPHPQVGTPANPDEAGPFFHGTAATLQVGDLLTPGYRSNYRPEIVMNHVYFTATIPGAGLAAELAADLLGADPHVYAVEPLGPWVDDPNVTDKRFPGNPTRSYRTDAPLRITAEITDWPRLAPEVLADWREKLAALNLSNAEIIN